MTSIFSDLPFPKSLGSDNHSGVHPKILKALLDANQGHSHSYGMDPISEKAAQEFNRVFGREVFAHYVFNGTAANVTALGHLLKPYQAVICSEQAHLHLDECGAPDTLARTKLLLLPSQDGKIYPDQMKSVLSRQGDQHHVQIKMVSLTQPTELGQVYTTDELKNWREFCDAHQLYLHCDGARISNAFASKNQDPKDYANFFDVLSFGGTKNGLMGAEAVLFFSKDLSQDFKFTRKQFLNLPSKTRFLAAQFYAYLFEDLFLKISKDVLSETRYLESELRKIDEIKIHFPVESNAIFASFPKDWIKPLKTSHFFYIWNPEKQMARLMVSFDWTRKDTDDFIQTIHQLKGSQ